MGYSCVECVVKCEGIIVYFGLEAVGADVFGKFLCKVSQCKVVSGKNSRNRQIYQTFHKGIRSSLLVG